MFCNSLVHKYNNDFKLNLQNYRYQLHVLRPLLDLCLSIFVIRYVIDDPSKSISILSYIDNTRFFFFFPRASLISILAFSTYASQSFPGLLLHAQLTSHCHVSISYQSAGSFFLSFFFELINLL